MRNHEVLRQLPVSSAGLRHVLAAPDDVVAVGGRGVAARAAVDDVALAIAGEQTIVGGSAVELVPPRPADQQVGSAEAPQDVVAAASPERVVARSPSQGLGLGRARPRDSPSGVASSWE